MNRTKIYLQLLLAALLLFHSGQAFCAQKVTATGLAFFQKGAEEIAKTQALNNAKRNALEKALGTSIESTSVVKNFQLVRDQIVSHARGYLFNTKVLKEEVTSFGTVKITIETDVKAAILAKDIEKMHTLLVLQKNPNIYVQINKKTPPNMMSAASRAQHLLIDYMQQSGFTILSTPQPKDAPAAGLITEISIVTQQNKTDYQGLSLVLNEVTLSAAIIRPSDNKILATAGAVSSIPGENRLKALDKGTDKCVSKIWQNLRSKLVKIWEKEAYGQRSISLKIKDIDYKEAQKLESGMQAVIGDISSILLKGFSQHTARFALKYNGWPEYLIQQMGTNYFSETFFYFKVNSLKSNSIVITKTK